MRCLANFTVDSLTCGHGASGIVASRAGARQRMDGAFIWRQFWYKPASQDVPVPTGFYVVPTKDFAE